MNNEHNIDDILKLLKESVERDSSEETPQKSEEKKSANLSEKKLKQQLRQQYGSQASDGTVGSESGEYTFDRELLLEFEAAEESESEEENVTGESLDEALMESEEDERLLSDPEENEKESIEEELITEAVVEESEEEHSADDGSDRAPWEEHEEDFVEEIVEETAEDAEERKSLDGDSLLISEPESEPILTLREDMQSEEKETEEPFADSEEDYDEFPEIQTIAMPELTQDFSSGDLTDGTEDISSLLSDTAVTEADETAPESTAEFCVNESIFNLMLQFGCQDELEEISEEEVTEEFAEEDGSLDDDGEYKSAAQDEEILANYRRRSIRSLIRLVSLGVLAVVVFLYDTLPLFQVEFKGLLDYHTYYGSYLLIGMQLTLIAAVCLGRSMWNGVKRLVSIHPDFYSVIAVMVLYTAAYDAVMVFTSLEGSQPPAFHFICVLWMLLVACAELVLLRRERKLFLIFSSQASKFTPELDSGAQSVAAKMYRGGISEEKQIYIPASVSFPNGFFRSVGRDNHMSCPMIPWILFPAVLLSLVAGMITMLLKQSLTVAGLSVLVTLLVLLPCAGLAIPLFTVGISSARLTKRGIALTNADAIASYSGVDYMVFNDLHLFKKCETKDTGMVIYEQRQAADLFGCLQLLYSKIGGPMAKTFENVPKNCRFDRIYFRRITRNGMEAIIDKKHVLIIGDAGYLQRYGLSFPMNEEWDGRATLCVSLDGRVSAKISAAYEIEPIFEMLIERMSENGVRCVIETFDPMIHSSFVLEQRRLGVTSVSVVHKNADDLKRNGRRKTKRSETGVLTLSSRLKLVEAAVWCKRLTKLRGYCELLLLVFAILGAITAGLTIGFGWMPFINQYWLMLLQLLPFLGILTVTVLGFPGKDYFTLESLRAELLRAAEKIEKKNQRKANKGNKKRS